MLEGQIHENASHHVAYRTSEEKQAGDIKFKVLGVDFPVHLAGIRFIDPSGLIGQNIGRKCRAEGVRWGRTRCKICLHDVIKVWAHL